MELLKTVLTVISLLLPWRLRRALLCSLWGYEIHPTSRIGFAWILPRKLIMEAGTHIDHLTVCRHLQLVHLKENSYIGKGNWITGYPAGNSKHFAHEVDRCPMLVLGEEAAITHRHILDCTSSVTIGAYSIIAGYNSQLMTHSLDLRLSRQASESIEIGRYCFLGTNVVVLGGSSLPDYSVLAAKSLLNKRCLESYCIYGGVPAGRIKQLPAESLFFNRPRGFVE